ncbi:hypothetical protein E2C01_090729 [Portunus trituberculatus]|uniref:Uncharacterized protein n=1 Tax=Portunus trituberculatus TaxID=210409 RepID=A0A5B7JM46_PORTR|nr:hypothetical protein [Portunus trituberculatus]
MVPLYHGGLDGEMDVAVSVISIRIPSLYARIGDGSKAGEIRFFHSFPFSIDGGNEFGSGVLWRIAVLLMLLGREGQEVSGVSRGGEREVGLYSEGRGGVCLPVSCTRLSNAFLARVVTELCLGGTEGMKSSLLTPESD